MENEPDKLKKALKQREAYRHRAFLLMLEIAFIIGIPALIAALVGHKLDITYAADKKYTVLLLLIAFILSWLIIIMKYKKFSRQVREIDVKLKKIKDEQNAPENKPTSQKI